MKMENDKTRKPWISLYKSTSLICTQHNNKGSEFGFLDSLVGRVTKEMCANLNKPYTKEKVVAALQQLNPTKAPTLDGMPLIFY